MMVIQEVFEMFVFIVRLLVVNGDGMWMYQFFKFVEEYDLILKVILVFEKLLLYKQYLLVDIMN